MKELKLLVWLTQLGLSAAVPPLLLIWLGLWLRSDCGWGGWVLWVCIGLSIYCAINALLSSLKTLKRLTGNKQEQSAPISYNEHN